MKDVLARLRGDEFVRNNAVFFVGSMLVAALNYLYHPIISRLLTVEQFGQVQGYLSIAMQLGVVATVFGMVLLNIKATAQDENEQSVVAPIYSLSLLVAGAMALGLLLLSPHLAQVFSLPQQWGWALVALVVFIGMPRVFARFHLQSQKRFGLVSSLELLVAGGKIVLALGLFWLGYEVLGAVGGFVLATLLGLAVAYPFAHSTIALRTLVWPRLTPTLMRELRYGGLVLLAIGFTTFLYTADILLIRYFFDDELSGQYAGIATVARIIFFGTASVAGVLLAHVSANSTAAANRQILTKGILMTLSIGGGALAVFSLMPELVVGLLMGQAFVPLAPLLPLLSLTMLLVSLTNLLVMYCLALRMFNLVYTILLASVTIAVCVVLWHSAVSSVVGGFVAGLVVALLLLSWQILSRQP